MGNYDTIIALWEEGNIKECLKLYKEMKEENDFADIVLKICQKKSALHLVRWLFITIVSIIGFSIAFMYRGSTHVLVIILFGFLAIKGIQKIRFWYNKATNPK